MSSIQHQLHNISNNQAQQGNSAFNLRKHIQYTSPASSPCPHRLFFPVDKYEYDDDDWCDDQQPLMFHLLTWATQQMQGQQSLPIEAKYFRQLRSAGTSAPFSLAALSQTGKALLMSSMHSTSRSWGQSAAKARAMRARSRAITFMLQIYYYHHTTTPQDFKRHRPPPPVIKKECRGWQIWRGAVGWIKIGHFGSADWVGACGSYYSAVDGNMNRIQESRSFDQQSDQNMLNLNYQLFILVPPMGKNVESLKKMRHSHKILLILPYQSTSFQSAFFIIAKYSKEIIQQLNAAYHSTSILLLFYIYIFRPMGGCASKTEDKKPSHLDQNKPPLQNKQPGKAQEKALEGRKLTKQQIDQKRQAMRNNLLQGRAEPPSSHAFQQVPVILNANPSD